VKTITASFEVPDNGQSIHINLADTHGIMVGGWVKIGFDQYRIMNVDSVGITVIKSKTVVPVGTIALFIEE
jgi:hypothetical protein